ncbi:MAG TPA: EAL domain-containing protein [Albitalea sp.]
MPTPANLVSPRLPAPAAIAVPTSRIHALRTSARVAGLIAAGLGVLGLLGGLLHWPPLATLGAGGVPMEPNSALMSLLCGVSLIFALRSPTSARRSTCPLAVAAFAVAALTLTQWASGWDFGVDGLIVHGGTGTPQRPSVLSALSFAMLSLGLIAMCNRGPMHTLLSEATALAAASAALVGLLGLVFSAPSLGGANVASSSGMALPSMLAVLALAAGMMSARPDGPVISVLASSQPGAQLGRRLLGWLLGAPLLAALLQAGVQQGWFSGTWALALGVSVAMAAMAAAIVSGARRLNAAALHCELELAQLRQAAVVFRSSNEAIVITDAQANILTANRAYEDITGYAVDELVGRNPRLMKSGRHDTEFYRTIWRELHERGAWRGEVWNRRKNGELYAVWQSISAIRDDDGGLTNYVALLADITAIKEAEARLQHLAHHAPLTDMPNRLLFASTLERSLAHARRQQHRLALLLVDLDRFKRVNDTLGHPAGDRLLQVMAERLHSKLRAGDTVARLGGDEFSVLIEDAGSRDEVAALAGKLVAHAAQPVWLEGRSVDTSISVGIAIFPDDAGTAADLTRAADAALYRAKASGRNTFSFHSAELTQLAARRLVVETSLRRAIGAGELRLHYQPQVDAASGQLRGLEALLRWQHPDQGLLLPDSFIGAAQESSLIELLEDWVLQEACRQARRWLDAGLQPRRIGVNLAGRHVANEQVAATAERAMRAARLDGPACGVQLQIEITESILHAGPGSAATLQALRGMGVKVVIEDFGAGHWSLAQLKELPIDALKIDRQFVQRLPDDADGVAMAETIVSIAHHLGLQAMAEGVETPAQHRCLQAMGCDEMQGHLSGRAMAPEDVAAWLAARG